MSKRVENAKWRVVKRLPPDAVAITGLSMTRNAMVEQGFQAGRSRYVATGWPGALNWFRIERSSRLYPPLAERAP